MSEEQWILVLKIVPSCIALITAIIGVIASIKGGKWKSLYKGLTAINDRTQVLFGFIKDAESHVAWDSADKLTYVLTQYKAYCLDNNVSYDEEEVTEEVESVISVTKSVNAREKDKSKKTIVVGD